MGLFIFWLAIGMYTMYLLLSFRLGSSEGPSSAEEDVLELSREDFNEFLLRSLAKRENEMVVKAEEGLISEDELELFKIQAYDEAWGIESGNQAKKVDDLYRWTKRKAKKEIFRVRTKLRFTELFSRVYVGLPLFYVLTFGSFNSLLFATVCTFVALEKHMVATAKLEDIQENASDEDIKAQGFTSRDTLVVSYRKIIYRTLLPQIPYLIMYLV